MGKRREIPIYCPECSSDRLHNKGRSPVGHKNPRFRCKDCGKNFMVGPKMPRRTRAKDLTGSEFGWLKIIGRADSRHKDDHAYWKCQCKCGNTIEAPTNSLKLGRTKSCGCLNSSPRPYSVKELTGKRFGKLVVIEKTKFKGRTSAYWFCKCDCGGTHIASGGNLTNGSTKSCGCLKGRHSISIAPSTAASSSSAF